MGLLTTLGAAVKAVVDRDSTQDTHDWIQSSTSAEGRCVARWLRVLAKKEKPYAPLYEPAGWHLSRAEVARALDEATKLARAPEQQPLRLLFVRESARRYESRVERRSRLQFHNVKLGLASATQGIEDAILAAEQAAEWTPAMQTGIDVRATLARKDLCGLGITTFELVLGRQERPHRLRKDLRAIRDELHPASALLGVLAELESSWYDEPDAERRSRMVTARVARVKAALEAGEKIR